MTDKTEFTIFDVETTGLFPYSGDKICEIAALRVKRSCKRPKKFVSLVDPRRPVSPGAFAVNGITDAMVAGQPVIEDVLPKFLKFARGSVLVAYNAGFDLGFIEAALGEKKRSLDEYNLIDALMLARRLFPEAGRYNLGILARHLGIPVPTEHRAMADCVTTLAVFEKELAELSQDAPFDIEDILYPRRKECLPVKKVKDYKRRLIEDAIREEKRLNITYRSAWNNELSERVVTPKEIRGGYDRSYLIAFCHVKKAERNFRVDCIVDASVVNG